MSVFGQIAAAAIPAVIGGVMGKSAAKYGAGANTLRCRSADAALQPEGAVLRSAVQRC